MGHALLSPSGASRWIACPGSVALESTCPESTTSYADEGTRAHDAAAALLQGAVTRIEDAEMAEAVGFYVDHVRARGGALLVEQRLPVGQVTGEDGATGTSDAVILHPRELEVIDLKYGRGVRVDAEDNPQLRLYALGALEEFGSLVGDVERVRMTIVQPRLSHVSEAVVSVDELRAWTPTVRESGRQAFEALRLFQDVGAVPERFFNPGEKQCRFCRAKATCPAIAAHVLATVADDFVDVTKPVAPQLADAGQRTFDNTVLGNLLGAVDLIEDWCRAVRAKAEAELLAGRPVPGYKLVEGRRGARAWSDAAAAEDMLRNQFRLPIEQAYELKLISPTSAEKLAKAGAIGPRQWPKLQGLITQPEGRPSVAPEADKRPALVVAATAAEFDDEEPLV